MLTQLRMDAIDNKNADNSAADVEAFIFSMHVFVRSASDSRFLRNGSEKSGKGLEGKKQFFSP